jgi:hypothetical protein
VRVYSFFFFFFFFFFLNHTLTPRLGDMQDIY